VTMSDRGVFNDIDVAMMVHSADQTYQSGTSSAMESLQFVYSGKASHAAASPDKGVNALDSVIQLFNGINALREHTTSDTRIHGIITEGGEVPNVVPERAVAKFYIRSKEKDNLDKVVGQLKGIGKGAALMTGAEVEISNFELVFDNMITHETMSDAFNKNMKKVAVPIMLPIDHGVDSKDMVIVGKVRHASHRVGGLNDPGVDFHTNEYADNTDTRDGHNAIYDRALTLAATGYDIL